MWFESKDNRNYKEILAKTDMGAELEKGRNLWAETSGGQIRKGPKPLATLLTTLLNKFNMSIRLGGTKHNVFPQNDVKDIDCF